MSGLRGEQGVAQLPSGIPDLFVELSRDTVAGLVEASTRQRAFDFERDDITKLHLWYRAAARLLCSQADATVFLMKEAVKQNLEHPGLKVSRRHREWLLRSPDKARFLDSVKIALSYYPLLVGFSSGVSLADEGFRAFKRLVECRAGISHPATPAQLFSLVLFESLKPGAEWFLLAYEKMLQNQVVRLGGAVEPSVSRSGLASASDARARAFEAKTQELIDDLFSGSRAEQFDWFVLYLAEDYCRCLEILRNTMRRGGFEDWRWAARALAMAEFACVEGLTLASGNYLRSAGHEPLEPPERLLEASDHDFVDRLVGYAEHFSSVILKGKRLNLASSRCAALLEGRRLRNRCAHPRSLQDLMIGAQEVRLLELLAGWLWSDFIPMFRTVSKQSCPEDGL